MPRLHSWLETYQNIENPIKDIIKEGEWANYMFIDEKEEDTSKRMIDENEKERELESKSKWLNDHEADQAVADLIKNWE